MVDPEDEDHELARLDLESAKYLKRVTVEEVKI